MPTRQVTSATDVHTQDLFSSCQEVYLLEVGKAKQCCIKQNGNRIYSALISCKGGATSEVFNHRDRCGRKDTPTINHGGQSYYPEIHFTMLGQSILISGIISLGKLSRKAMLN